MNAGIWWSRELVEKVLTARQRQMKKKEKQVMKKRRKKEPTTVRLIDETEAFIINKA